MAGRASERIRYGVLFDVPVRQPGGSGDRAGRVRRIPDDAASAPHVRCVVGPGLRIRREQAGAVADGGAGLFDGAVRGVRGGQASAVDFQVDRGAFESEDKILVIYNDGYYEITDQELTQKIDTEKVLLIEKFNPEKIISAIYLDKKNLQYNVKRFKIETTTLKNKFFFIKEGEGNYLEAVSTDDEPILAVQTGRGAQMRKAKFKIAKTVEVMGWKTVGNKLLDYNKSVEMEWDKPKGSNKQPELF